MAIPPLLPGPMPIGLACTTRERGWRGGMPALGHACLLASALTAFTGPRRAFGTNRRPGGGVR